MLKTFVIAWPWHSQQMQIMGIQLNTTGDITIDFLIAIMTTKTFAVSALIHWNKTHLLLHRRLLLLLFVFKFVFQYVFVLVSIKAFNTQFFLCCAFNDAAY